MIRLAEELDNHGIDYIWYVFTNSLDCIRKPNVIFMKNRLDVSRWIAESDYLIQLSDTEACSYAINEALYRNIPVICTKLPYLKEIGVEDKKNGYLMDFDCGNIEEIVENITNIPRFEFKPLKDRYNKILAKSKSHYKEERKMNEKKVKVRALPTFEQEGIVDADVKRPRTAGEIFETTMERYNILAGNNAYGLKFVELVEEPKEVETAKKEVKTEKAVKKTTKAKKNAEK